jgi:hypothetical protein
MKRRDPAAGSAQTEQQRPGPGYIVIESKSSGREAVVGCYEDYTTARSVVKLLQWAGGTARIEPTL